MFLLTAQMKQGAWRDHVLSKNPKVKLCKLLRSSIALYCTKIFSTASSFPLSSYKML